MFRIIILLVLLAVSFTVVKLLRANWDRRTDKAIKNKQKSDNILQCVCCGIYIPEKKAVIHGDKIFCSLEHAKQHKK